MHTQSPTETQSEMGLAGRRVALARSASEARTPASALVAEGAELVYYPCLEILPSDNLAELDDHLQRLVAGDYDWLVLPTATAVIVLSERLAHLKIDPKVLASRRVALYGATTRLAAQELLQLDVASLPEAESHEELVRKLDIASDSRVLLLLPAGARSDWPALLGGKGVKVTSVAAYRACMGQGGDALPAMLWSGEIDALVFTSENNVRYFAKRLHYEGGTLAMLDDVTVVCIEPQTAAAARALGLHVAVVPEEHTPEALADALTQYYARRSR